MPSLLGRLYRRLGPGYFWLYMPSVLVVVHSFDAVSVRDAGESFNAMMRGLSEREALRGAFGSYVDPVVAERVLEEGQLLEGEDREVTVMFVDVRDFTPRAERSSARETVEFLSEFFDLVVPLVLDQGGHANKFLGDGLLAVFGAPERHADHADRAVASARAIVAAVERHFRRRGERGHRAQLRARRRGLRGGRREARVLRDRGPRKYFCSR